MPLVEIAIAQHVPEMLREMFDVGLVEGIMDDIAEGARAKWAALARANLGSTKEEYIRGIQPGEAAPGMRIITLVGWLPNSVEGGLAGFDLRTTILGPNSRIRRAAKGGGFYANVPFRHATPGATSMPGTPMDAAYGPRGEMYAGAIDTGLSRDEASDLGREIYAMARTLKASKTEYLGAGRTKTTWGGRFDHPDAAPLLRGPNPTHDDPRMRRGHLSHIWQGMVRVRQLYSKATQSQYMTWRRISTNSPHGWIHPGIQARHFADQVTDWVSESATAAIRRALERSLGDL